MLTLFLSRLLLTEDGNTLVVADRRAPAVIVVSSVLAEHPVARIVYTAQSPLYAPLQAAAWPIVTSFQHPTWDTNGADYADGNIDLRGDEGCTRARGSEKGLPVSYACCFLGAGNTVWLAPLNVSDQSMSSSTLDDTSEDRSLWSIAELCPSVANNGKERDFLCHEIIPLTSNTVLLLNRDRAGTGLYQLSTEHNWSCDAAKAPLQRFLTGSEWRAPHGMTLSLSRRELLVVETGQGDGNDGHSGGRITVVNLSLSPDELKVVVGDVCVLQQVEAASDWNPLDEEDGSRVRREPFGDYNSLTLLSPSPPSSSSSSSAPAVVGDEEGK